MASDAHRIPATTARRMPCPQCNQLTMRRISRSGFLRRKLFPLFGLYPWECITCRIEKLFRNRGPKTSSPQSRQ